jgi:hypothetical protein
MMMMRRLNRLILCSAAILVIAGCSSDLTKSASPVALIASNTQTISRVDLIGGANCDKSLGVIHLQATEKNPGENASTFNQVRITGYHVSYVRTDGGKLVPAPFDRAMDSLISTGSTSDVSGFIALLPEALFQAPFAALFPQNGGKDPDTGLSTIRMNIVVDIFGQTLAGEKVSASTVMPVDFCYNCGGCS